MKNLNNKHKITPLIINIILCMLIMGGGQTTAAPSSKGVVVTEESTPRSAMPVASGPAEKCTVCHGDSRSSTNPQ